VSIILDAKMARRLGSKEARSSKVKAESEKGGSSRLKGKEARSSRLKASRRGSEKARKLKAESSKLKVAKAVIMKILSVQHHLNPLH